MANSNSYANTITILPLAYNEIDTVCFASLYSIPSKDNYKGIVPECSPENLADPDKLIPLNRLGGPNPGTVTVAELDLPFGTEYEYGPDGNVLVDEYGQPIIAEDNGVLFGLEIPESIKKKSFNAIICYSINPDNETGYPSIGLITILNNFIKFDKILNFCVRYIIDIELEIINLELEYWDIYKEHNKNIDTSLVNMEKVHTYLTDRMLVNESAGKDNDPLNVMAKKYSDFINAETLYFQIKDDIFDKLIQDNQIQVIKDIRFNKMSDDVIRSQYLYFFYNLYVFKFIIEKGIVEESLNTEDTKELKKISLLMLRKHCKIGFSEPSGPFIYTWFSTPRFIYVCLYGSNSNNNIDIYRVINKKNYDINAENFNLVVGKYLDRVYFTINGDLHVCIPESINKIKVPLNTNSVEDAKICLVEDDLFLYYPDPKTVNSYNDKSWEGLYKKVVTDIDSNKSNIYYITKEQLYLFILSYSETGGQYVEDGVFVPGTSKATSAVDLIDRKKIYVITTQDQKNVVLYLKNPTDRINTFIEFLDSLVKECESYKTEYEQESIKVNYINQVFQYIVDNMGHPSYSLGDNYIENWTGIEGESGVKYTVLIPYFTQGPDYSDNAGKKYIDYSKSFFERLSKVVLNMELRLWLFPSSGKVQASTSELTTFYNGVYSRLLGKDPLLKDTAPMTAVRDYMSLTIFEEDDILDAEYFINKYKRYSNFRSYYDYAVDSTKNLSEFVLRKYLINKAGTDSAEIDRINMLSVSEVTAEFEASYLNGLLGMVNSGNWWDESILEQLNDLYKEVSFIECFDYISYSDKDSFYYNGKLKKDIPLNVRSQGIPYRYGFPYPNYIYNSADSDLFIIPEHPAIEPTETYKSKIALEEALLNPIYDSTVETKADLQKVTQLIATLEVDTDAELSELITPLDVFETDEEKNNAIEVTGYVESKENLPEESEEGDRYFVKDEKQVYIYKQPSYSIDDKFPVLDGLYNVTQTYSYFILRYGENPLNENTEELYWESYQLPIINSIAYSKESDAYFRFNGQSWEGITQEDYTKEFIGKKYGVINGEDDPNDYEFYVFNGTDWEKSSVSYNIDKNNIYCVTNEVETITEYLDSTPVENDSSSVYSFSVVSKNKEHSFTFSNFITEKSKLTILLTKANGTEVTRQQVKVEGDEAKSITLKYTIPDLGDYKISLFSIQQASVSISYLWERSPGDTGVKYYQWDGVKFVLYKMQIIPESNSCAFKYGQSAFINLFLEGDKLYVNRDVFRNSLTGDTCKVVQFEFSDLGDIVLVLNYNNQGQTAWGGVFSRNRETDTNGLPIKWGKSLVISQDIKECFNWESYPQILFSVNSNGQYEISDKRVQGLLASYEVSRSHVENLSHLYDVHSMIFSNALTVAFNIDEKNQERIKIFSKNIRMVPHLSNLVYKGAKVDVNNYFVIMGASWCDMVYNRLYSMVASEVYSKTYLTSSRGLCITAVHDFRDDNEPVNLDGSSFDGAVSNFNINAWYSAQLIKDYFESTDIPEKKY